MNELEIKELVEKIVSLEKEADSGDFQDTYDDWAGSFPRHNEVEELEKQIEQAGYMLGEDGEDMLVYRSDQLLFVRSSWLIFDRAKREWRISS